MVALCWSFIKSAVAQVGTLSVLLSVALDVSVVLSVPPRIPDNRGNLESGFRQAGGGSTYNLRAC